MVIWHEFSFGPVNVNVSTFQIGEWSEFSVWQCIELIVIMLKLRLLSIFIKISQ